MTDKLPPPPARLAALPDDLLSILAATFTTGVPDEHAHAWVEKLRRFVELAGKRLPTVAADRFGSSRCRTVLAGIATVLVHAAGRAATESAEGMPDLPTLNAALRALDVAGSEAPDATTRLADDLLATAAALIARRGASPATAHGAGGPGDIPLVDPSMRIVIICRRGALFGTTVLHLLRACGLRVSALVMVEANGWRRLVAWVRSRLPLAPWACRLGLLPKHFWVPPPGPCLLRVARTAGVRRIGSDRRSIATDVHVLTVRDLHDPRLTMLLESMSFDAVVHTQGSILPPAVIARAGRGALNAHNCVLPGYRGLDAAHWALLEGRPDLIGVTGHVIDRGVDSGPALVVRRLDATAFASPHALRAAYWALMPTVLVESTCALLGGRRPEPQPPGSRQYFAVHPRLRPLVQQALDRVRSVC